MHSSCSPFLRSHLPYLPLLPLLCPLIPVWPLTSCSPAAPSLPLSLSCPALALPTQGSPLRPPLHSSPLLCFCSSHAFLSAPPSLPLPQSSPHSSSLAPSPTPAAFQHGALVRIFEELTFAPFLCPSHSAQDPGIHPTPWSCSVGLGGSRYDEAWCGASALGGRVCQREGLRGWVGGGGVGVRIW